MLAHDFIRLSTHKHLTTGTRLSERPPFAWQYAAYCHVKGGILSCKMPSFTQKTSHYKVTQVRDKNHEQKLNVKLKNYYPELGYLSITVQFLIPRIMATHYIKTVLSQPFSNLAVIHQGNARLRKSVVIIPNHTVVAINQFWYGF